MRIYISGPMRNRPFYNFEEFDQATRVLQKLGHKPWSPADGDRALGFDALKCDIPGIERGCIPDGASGLPPLKDLVLLDTVHLIASDGLVTLRDWWTSVGARAEYALGCFLGLQIFRIEYSCAGQAYLMPGRWDPPDEYPL